VSLHVTGYLALVEAIFKAVQLLPAAIEREGLHAATEVKSFEVARATNQLGRSAKALNPEDLMQGSLYPRIVTPSKAQNDSLRCVCCGRSYDTLEPAV